MRLHLERYRVRDVSIPTRNVTYVLAGLVYVGRALLREWAIPTKNRPGVEDVGDRFAQVRNTWLCRATYSPMGYTLSLLLYCRGIAKQTGQWQWASVRKYLKQVNEFEKLLLLLAQILRVSQVEGKRSLAYAPSM